MRLVLKSGAVRVIGLKPLRNKMVSLAAKERRFALSQKVPTNVGNPNKKGGNK